MNGLFEEILKNLTYVGSVILLIFIFQVDNMVFGLVNNVGLKGQKFDTSKIKNWFFRSVLTLIGISLLTLGVSLIPYIVSFTNIEIPAEYGDVITVALIIITGYKSVLTEANKAYEHFKTIMS